MCRTKDGREITFNILEDEEGDNNRGWQVDRILAQVEGMPAGYISLTYIPKERFCRYYRTIFNWMCQIEGMAVLPFDKRTEHWKNLTSDEKRKLLINCYLYRFTKFANEQEIQNIPETELDKEIKKVERLAKQYHGKKFKKFHDRFVDKPYEDYVRVFAVGEHTGRRGTGMESEYDFRRQGVGLALYLKAAEHFEKKGLQMRLSKLRSETGGQAIGNALIKLGLTVRNGRFEYLDPEKVRAFRQGNKLSNNYTSADALFDERSLPQIYTDTGEGVVDPIRGSWVDIIS